MMKRSFQCMLSGAVFVLAACSAPPYKRADLSFYGGRQGYLERQVAANTYIVEYAHIGGYNYDLSLNKTYWHRRAMELCPKGFVGEPEVVHPANARIEQFVCPQRFCTQYPLVTGLIKCET